MAQRIIRNPVNDGTLAPVIGKNSEVFAMGSPVTIDGNGFLAVASKSGEKIYGFCMEDKTCASDNQTVAQYKPLICSPVNVVWECGTATIAQTDIGEYADIASVSSGVCTMANPSTSGQFILVEMVDTTTGRYMVAEPQQLAFAQA